jgi:DNA-binding response OmpR family regulator
MKKKILVVDDEPQIVRLLTLRLKAKNFDVISAYDGYQCVQVAKAELPDLILLDIKMPLGGGIKAYETMKNIASISIIPIIFITAFPSVEVRKLVMDMGAEDFVSKPFNSDQLIDKINKILKISTGNATKDALISKKENSNYLDI